MAGYTKLFNSILASTVWNEPSHVRIVWITLLAMAGKNGVAEGSVPGIAHFARVSPEEAKDAIYRLMLPDPDSRSKEHEGRRIAAVDGGFLLLNHGKHRGYLKEDERREYLRVKQQEYRGRRKRDRQQITATSTDVNMSTPPDPDPDPDPTTKQEREREPAPAAPSPSHAFVDAWNTETQPPIPRATHTTTRRRKILSRLRERALDDWLAVFRRLNASAFCRGENDRGWVASIDWVIRAPDVSVKILEGAYDDRAGKTKTGGWEDYA